MGQLIEIYDALFHAFGPQHWWPGDSPFEIAVGAILTQNTNWANVEKAIRNLKQQHALSAKAIHMMSPCKISALIRPAGYFTVKAKRLKCFVSFLMNEYKGSMARMQKEGLNILRERLLQIHGIGPETADSILLYALRKPVFVIDAYTKRVLSRHSLIGHDESYDQYQDLFYAFFKKDVGLFNEFHALFVKVGKTYCRKTTPLCDECPLNNMRSL